MADARFHFIELASRALRGNPPAHELARGELMDRLAHADPAATDDSLEAACARLERGGPRPARQAAVMLGGLLVLLGFLLPLLGGACKELKQLNPHYGFLGLGTRQQKEFESRLTAGMTPEERLFLLANTRYAEAAEVVEWQQSFEKELPGDPAWLEEAILTSESPDPRLRERLVQIGASLEPDNGFWDLLEGFRSKRNAPFLEAFAKPRIESHIPARTKRRLEMLGRPRTLAEQVEQNHFVFRQRSWPELAVGRSMVVHGSQARGPEDWRKTMDMWAAFGFELPTWGDRGTEFQKLNGLGAAVLMLEGDARARGLTNEEERMKRMKGVLSGIPSVSSGGFGIRARPGASPPVPATSFRPQASSITRNAADNALPGTFTAEDFTPGRLAEHAVFDRYMALCGATIFVLFAVLAAFEGWRRLPARRGLAAGLIPLFKAVDAAWVAGLGILLPLAWHIGITRFTPLGCRYLGLMEWDMMPGLQQAGGSLLFSACMLQQTLRWRLAKRMGLIGLRASKLWSGWTVAAVAALFVPAIGMVVMVPRQQETFLLLGSSMAGIPMLWLIWRAGMTALQPQEAALEGVLLSRLLVPAYTVAAGVLLLAVVPLQKEERKWVARDTLGSPATDGSLMQAIDARTLAGIRAALREAWDGQ